MKNKLSKNQEENKSESYLDDFDSLIKKNEEAYENALGAFRSAHALSGKIDFISSNFES